jgi:RimJ/RimL family protein N-acetyltransferase
VTYSLPIETNRLTLRAYRESDFDDLLKLQSNDDVTRFLLYDSKTPAEVGESLAKRLTDVPMNADGQALTLAVILRETGQHLGEVTLFVNSTEHNTGEIGFVFHPESHGHGYAAEAAVELLRLGFEELGMHRIIGQLWAANTASANLLERLGLRLEAHFIRAELHEGEWADGMIFAMLDDEWRARSSPTESH